MEFPDFVEIRFSDIMHKSQLSEIWNTDVDMVTAKMKTFPSEIKLMFKLSHAKKSR